MLVTGGAGSLGTELCKLLAEGSRTVRVFDSNEYGLYKLQHEVNAPNVRYLLGDIRDRERVKLALEGVDVVIHAAAVKNIEISEYNVPETIRTNIEGTTNLVELAREKVDKFLFLSSDKAVDHTTLYGATKFVGERTVLWAHQVSSVTRFAVFRPMNFFESRGNVFELWEEQKKAGLPLTVTDKSAKRYFVETKKAAELVVKALEKMQGGEIFVPKGVELSMLQLARSLYPDAPLKIVGLRYQEKLTEALMTRDEKTTANEVEDMWIVYAK